MVYLNKTSPMKALLLSSVLALLCGAVNAQKSPIKFGDVPMEDLKMTVYDKDSSASAVILADYAEAYVSISSVHASLNFERHVRIKILKKEGLSWADAQIPLYYEGSNEEKVTGLKAASYNLEAGKVVETKMSKDGVFKENSSRNYKIQKFTIPNAKEGSVIEFSYTIMSDFISAFPNWRFQYSIPSKHSEYWAILPEFFIFEKYMQGYLIATSYEIKEKSMGDYRSKAHHWIMKDVPAFKEEPYMTCEDDYVSKINFAISHYNFPGEPIQEIMGSWSKLNTNFLESEAFGKAVTGNGFLKKKTEEITAGVSDPAKKINIIYDYVRQNIEWNGTNDMLADPLKKVLELKKGTTGDINIFLASMLEKAGFEVDLVLLSTRDHGFVRKEYPMTRQFNYVICAVRNANTTTLLDATDRYIPINVLPERCLNGQALVISKDRHGWIDLQPKAKARTVIDANFALKESGELKGMINFTRDGYDAHRMRKDYMSKGEETYVKDFLKTTSWQISKTEFKDVKDLTLSAKENHELSIQEHASVAGDMIYFNPFVTSQLENNPFKLETRQYPVDFGSAIEKVYMCKITVPENYAVDELPKSRSFVLPANAARFLFNVAQNGNTITVTSTLSINKNLFLQDEYLNLREFYSQVIAKQSEQIVLKKK
jgi:hypothetical protein